MCVCVCVCVCGEGNGSPLQYSCLENLMDRGAWRVHGVTESDTITTEQYICVCVYFLKLVFIYLFLAEPGLGSCE